MSSAYYDVNAKEQASRELVRNGVQYSIWPSGALAALMKIWHARAVQSQSAYRIDRIRSFSLW